MCTTWSFYVFIEKKSSGLKEFVFNVKKCFFFSLSNLWINCKTSFLFVCQKVHQPLQLIQQSTVVCTLPAGGTAGCLVSSLCIWCRKVASLSILAQHYLHFYHPGASVLSPHQQKGVNTSSRGHVMLCLFIWKAHKANCTYGIYSIYKVVYVAILAQFGTMSSFFSSSFRA